MYSRPEGSCRGHVKFQCVSGCNPRSAEGAIGATSLTTLHFATCTAQVLPLKARAITHDHASGGLPFLWAAALARSTGASSQLCGKIPLSSPHALLAVACSSLSPSLALPCALWQNLSGTKDTLPSPSEVGAAASLFPITWHRQEQVSDSTNSEATSAATARWTDPKYAGSLPALTAHGCWKLMLSAKTGKVPKVSTWRGVMAWMVLVP